MRNLVCLVMLLASAVPAAAQSAGKLAVGASIGTRIAPSSTVGGDALGIGLLWRIGHPKEGFGWEWGFNWFASGVDHSFSGTPAFAVGELHIRPLMAGYGYTHVMGPNSIKGSVQGGYAFTSFNMGSSASEMYAARVGAGPLSIDTANTFVVRPQVTFWRDVSPKVGVNATAGFMIARPALTISTRLGEDRQRVHADQFMLKMGVVYSVF